MRTLRDLPPIENVPVLVRTALNVPIEQGTVTNDYRLRRALPTIHELAERGARVVLISHIGEKGTETLEPVTTALQKLIANVSFCPETIGERARAAIRNLVPGDILVLENLRRNRGERENDPLFAQELATLADFFVQDSFDTCHREHASIVGVPQLLPSYAGLLLEDEIRELSSARDPKRPALAIIGGAKFTTKEPVLTALLKKYDHVCVGGALASDFLKASGKPIGLSLTSATDEESVHALLANTKLVVPEDSVVIPAQATTDAKKQSRIATDDIGAEEAIVDIGPASTAHIAELAKGAKTILWNGPLGKYEGGFVDATDAVARAIADSGARSVIGGGDTIAAIDTLDLLSHFSFVSTGGGAMLDFLTHGTLPGIEALG